MPLPLLRPVLVTLALALATPAGAQQPAGPPRIAPVEAQVSAFEPIRVQWSNMPTSLSYASALLLAAGEDRTLSTKTVDLTTPEKKRSGVVAFDGTLPGEYEVRIVTSGGPTPYVLARTRVSVFDPNQQAAPAVQPGGRPEQGAPSAAPQPGGLGQTGRPILGR